MATERNERIIDGYSKLTADEKKRAVKLKHDFYILYPMELSENKFKLTEEQMNKSASDQLNDRKSAQNSLKTEATRNDFKERNQQMAKFAIEGSAVLTKDWKFMSHASTEMQWVRKSLAALNSILSEGMDQYMDQNGQFDRKKYLDRVNKAFDEFYAAAENYRKTRSPKSIAGKRRYRRISNLLSNAKRMQGNIMSLADAVQDGSIDLSKKSVEEKATINSLNLVNQLPSDVAVSVEWQNQGNSTDVYRVKLQGEDGKFYYLKENLPFLNQNIEEFLERRTRQLKFSKESKEKNTGKEEERLKEITIKDYESGIKFLQALTKELNNASDVNRIEVEKKISKYFAHNFDDVFRRFEINNLFAEHNIKDGQDIDAQIEEAISNGNKLLADALKNLKAVQKENNANPQEYKKMTAQEWLKKELNLDDRKDSAFLKALNGLSDAEVERLFRVTMGKEVELFGQMSSKKIQSGNDIAAINNTATATVAEQLGFDDVITMSKTALVKFERRDGTTVNQLCTLSEEAIGTELVDLMKEAEKDKKKIVYSSEAIRNLMRLQIVDTLCLQKDRHGRNFKCDVDRVGDKIIVKSVKAYDNDMSFENLTLAEAFKDGERYQFLPSMTTTVEQDSALYKYIMGHYFGVDALTPRKQVETPKFDIMPGYTMKLSEGDLGYGAYYSFVSNKQVRDLNSESMYFGYKDFTGFGFRKELPGKERAEVEEEIRKLWGNKLDKDEPIESNHMKKYALDKYAKLVNEIKDIWIKPEVKNNTYEGKLTRYNFLQEAIRKDLKPNEVVALHEKIEELRKLQRQFDFSLIHDERGTPLPDLCMKGFTFLFDVTYGDNLYMRYINQNPSQEAKEAMLQLIDEKGNLNLPTMLHFDNDAYQKLQNSVVNYRNKDSVEYRKLLERGLSAEKIEALAKRNEEMLAKVGEAAKKAELFYKVAGWVKTDPKSGKEIREPRAKFLLNQEDYKKIGKLTDFAIDPGKTYLSVDNENFLAGQTFKMKDGKNVRDVKYTELMSESEKLKAKDYNKSLREDKKRWKYEEAEKKSKKYDVNSMGDDTANFVNGKEYLRVYMEDAVYDLAHAELKSKEDVTKKVSEVLVRTVLREGVLEANQGEFPVENAKKLVETNSDARNTFTQIVNTPFGKEFFEKLVDRFEAMRQDGSIKKTDSLKFKQEVKNTLNATLDGLFSKIDPLAKNEELYKSIIRAENISKSFGTPINANEALEAWATKHVQTAKVAIIKSELNATRTTMANNLQKAVPQNNMGEQQNQAELEKKVQGPKLQGPK